MTSPKYNRSVMGRKDKAIVDRGDTLEGFNTTLRDSRLPPTLLRDITNFRLPDQKAVRRRGFTNYTVGSGGSDKLFRGSVLTKHTPSLIETAEDRYPADSTNPLYNKQQLYYRVPLSYGLIKWDADIQPRTDRDWTLEMSFTTGDREELIENSVNRQMYRALGGSTDSCRLPGDTHGVYIYDQTVMGARMRYANDSSVVKDPSTVSSITLAVPAVAISYRIQSGNLRISCAFGFFDPTTGIYEFNKLIYNGATYSADVNYHIAIVHTSSTRGMELFIDGTSADTFTYTSGLKWAGEDDLLGNRDKDVSDNKPKRRDIVVLNEFTARGNYNSAVKSDGLNPSANVFAESLSTLSSENRGSPWACSPPRGTKLGEIRFWHEARSSLDIGLYKNTRIHKPGEAIEATLKMWLPCNDGYGFCADASGHKNHMTLHHTYAQTIDDSSLLNGKGILLRDGQHLIKSYDNTVDGLYINDSYTELLRTFQNRRDNTAAGDGVPANFNSKYFNPDQDFTIQVQIRTPKNFQYNLSEYIAASTPVLHPGSAVSTKPGSSLYALTDGTKTTQVDLADSTGANKGGQFLDPFMETIWSVEATVNADFGVDTDNVNLHRRIPLARGMLQADDSGANAGKARVVFEFFGAAKDSSGTAEPRYYKLFSTTYLDPDTVYTLTFRKVTNFGLTDSTGGSTGTTDINPVGTDIEIYIDDATIPDTMALVDSTPVAASKDIDVIIGASYVNNLVEKGLQYNGVSSIRGNIVDQQHFMNQYTDQPGFFTLGFFRMWTAPIPQKQFVQWISTSIVDQAHQTSLVYNLEVDDSKGSQIRSKSRYAVNFKKGYKSFGMPTFRSLVDKYAFIQSSWLFEDCLGYSSLPDMFNEWAPPVCTGLAPFKSNQSDKYGILAFEDSVIIKDLESTGLFSPGYLPSYGLLSEYAGPSDWRAGLIDDRTFFFGESGFPKVFNGKHFTTLGLRPWNAGRVVLSTTTTGGSLGSATLDKYIGFRIVYISEEFDIIASSPQFVAHIPKGTTTNKITIKNLSPHPDPRVTDIYIYRTTEQVSYQSAKVAATFLVNEGPLQNRIIQEVTITQSDDTIIGSPLDLNITEVPDAEYGAILNGQLYLNDKNAPSSIFRSYPGNPEQFDKISTEVVLDEGVGDKINGMIAAFGAVFVFKSSSVWRLDPLDTVNLQQTKINDLGLISPLGMLLITPGDTGGQAIFTWTKQGPYLFDGVNWQYIGFATEGSLDNPYDFLDPSTISVVHVPKDRELLCFYKSINPSTGLANNYYDGCIVYNYRFNIWYTYEGVVGFKGLTTVINSDTQKDLILIGDERGQIQKWGALDTDFYAKTTGLISAYTASTGFMTLSTPLPTSDVARLWITVVRYNGTEIDKFFSWPMLSADNASSIYLDLNRNSGALPFTPIAGDTFIAGLTPARLTFPWDVMDVPWVDKQVMGSFFWLDKDFYLRTAIDWDETYSTWSILSSSLGKRKLHAFAPSKHCEALKLDLVSFEESARLDAFAYQVHYKEEGVSKQ